MNRRVRGLYSPALSPLKAARTFEGTQRASTKSSDTRVEIKKKIASYVRPYLGENDFTINRSSLASNLTAALLK